MTMTLARFRLTVPITLGAVALVLPALAWATAALDDGLNSPRYSAEEKLAIEQRVARALADPPDLASFDPGALLGPRKSAPPGRDLARAAAPKVLPPAPKPRPEIELAALVRPGFGLADLKYDLTRVRRGIAQVPAVYLTKLPPELGRFDRVELKKQAFIKMLLPLVLDGNRRLLAQRRRLNRIADRIAAGGALTPESARWLDQLSLRFDVEPTRADRLEELKLRVDAVPPSLAIAQSAEESGWGTSRFARLGNAVFGQRTWRPGAGIVPRRRDRGLTHEVRAFETLTESVDGYLANLNSHPAYGRFRDARARLRRQGRPLDGAILAGTLERYSERRADYVATIRRIMRANRLDQFDKARLADRQSAGLVPDGP